MKTTTLVCDIQDTGHTNSVKEYKVFAVFDHDQNDGKSKTPPYINNVVIDLCTSCRKRMEEGSIVYAHGAMGHNKFWLKTLI